ncbi:GNAT family N-acetyltransferase [Nocardia grenadensis]|uniref:GNAT family N-acetyltransferase n=1 Tax=Nocardia grenadensis TaxID=931537 RepID=UPI003D929B64
MSAVLLGIERALHRAAPVDLGRRRGGSGANARRGHRVRDRRRRDPTRLWGGASIYDITIAEGRAAVGYWLAGHARGRGSATRTVRLLARWAFDDLSVARLELTCGPDNLASQQVAERSGFTREGLLRSHLPFKGGRRDSVLFSLLPTDPGSR